MKGTIGGILIAVGILIAGANGLCALAVLFSGDADRERIGSAMIFMGGIFFLVGIGIIFWGRALVRSTRKRRDVGGRGD